MSDTLAPAAGFTPAPASGYAPQSVNYFSTPDPAKYLPAGPPADRYRALVFRAEDLHKLIPSFATRHQASLDRLEVEARLKRLTGHRSTGGFELSDDSPQVKPVRQELAERAAEQKRLTELDAVRSKAWHSCGALLSNVKAWIATPRSTVMEAIKVSPPKLQKLETVTAAIDRLRQQAKELRASIAQIENAPLPIAYARAQLKEQFAAIAKRGEISVEQLLQREGGQISFPETLLSMKVHSSDPAAVATGSVPDMIGMLLYANPDLLAALDKKLAAAASDGRALTPEQKQKQIAQATETLFAVELDEATLTFAAWQDGSPVEANPSIGPAALLAVRNVVPPPTDTATSPQHAYAVVGPGQ